MKRKKMSIWDEPRTKAAIALAYKGIKVKVIARLCELSMGQAQYRLSRHGVSTTSWRNADTDEARRIVARILTSRHMVVPKKFQIKE